MILAATKYLGFPWTNNPLQISHNYHLMTLKK
jgi:hypothetical protein